jgi:hypothetical protein
MNYKINKKPSRSGNSKHSGKTPKNEQKDQIRLLVWLLAVTQDKQGPDTSKPYKI